MSTRLSRFSKSIIPIVFFGIVAMFVFYRMFFEINGYFDFGNMLSIYNSKSYVESIFSLFNPFQNNGYVLIIPPPNIEFVVLSHFFYYVSIISSASFSVKLLVFVSTLMLSLAFYFLVSELTSHSIARYISAIFFVYEPFSLELFAQGDFFYFIFQSLFIFSIVFLVRFYRDGANKHYMFIVSLILLFLSCGFLDIFYVGLVEFIIFGLFSLYIFAETYGWKVGRQTLKFFAMYLLIIPISLPLIYSFLFPPISLAPTSPLALSLSSYVNNSVGILKTLSLESYPPNVAWVSVSGVFGMLYLPWEFTEFTVIVFALLVGIIYLNKKTVIFSMLTLLSTIIAAGAKGPLGTVLIWAYQKLPGFQLLNYPYIITWTVSTLMLSLLLGFLLDIMLEKKDTNKIRFPRYKGVIQEVFQYRKIASSILVFMIVFVIIIPVATQGYYGTDGIHATYIPKDYEKLSGYLTKLNANSYYGDAFFNPSSYIFFNNASGSPFTNPVIYDIPARTPAIPGYITEPLPSYNFFNWAYYEFYSNSTHFFPEILASVGYKYFVDLYRTNSADFYPQYMTHLTLNVNASSLLANQNDVTQISSAKDYSVYSYADNFSLAGIVRSFTILAGNYNLLNTLASDGVNLLNLTPLFLSDTLNYNLSDLLSNTSSIVEFNNEGLANLVLMHSPNYTNIFKLKDKSGGWKNSFSKLTNWYVNEVALPSQFLVTSSNASISIPISNGSAGSTLWLKVLKSDVPGDFIKIKIGNKTLESLSTYNSTLSSNTTGFQWINVTLPKILNTDKITVDAIGSFNGLEAYSIEPVSWFTNELKLAKQIISKQNISIIDFANMSATSVRGLYAGNSSLNGLIALNSTITPNMFGLTLSGARGEYIYVRAPFQDFASSSQYSKLLPAFDSMGMTLTVLNSGGSIKISVYDVKPEIIAYTISLSTILIFLSATVVLYRRRHTVGKR